MIRTMQKPRSRWAVLAAGAMVASVLATGATPAVAVTDRADHTTPLSACVGDAVVDQLFADVSMGHVFRDAINCIAYYAITEGTDDGSTYSPEQDVTRAQMAVFISRAAEAAGVDLGDAMDVGFTDIADIWGEAQDAINRIASKGMIPAGGAYRPEDPITRAEMATFLVGLLIEAAPNVTRESSGAILLGEPGLRSRADDHFPDARGAEIAAIYELGVTRGASVAEVQDDTEPPLDFNYEPDGTVNRGQMAAFITRALAHTSVRPAGVSAQYDGADVIVSVRNAKYQPVPRAAVDVFWTTADQVDGALSTGGTCVLSAVTQADLSSLPCEIDDTDPTTGRAGDATVAVTGLRRVPEGGATVWAWTGRTGATLAAGAGLYRLDVAEGADIGYASTTLVSTALNARKVRFGRSVLYTMQLRDVAGDVSAGVNGVDPAQWNLSVRVTGEDPDEQTLVSDRSGAAAFTISVADPNPGTADGDLTVTYTLTALENTPPGAATVDASGKPSAVGRLIFSDDDPSISSANATVIIDTRDYVHVLDGFAANSVTVSVLDQYGSVFPGAKVRLQSSGLSRVTLDSSAEFTIDGRGSRRFAYQYSGPGGEVETLTAGYGVNSANEGSRAKTVYWAVDAGPDSDDDDLAVVTGDVGRREIVVDDDGDPLIVVYDDNDRFNLRGSPTTITVFEDALAEALKRASPGVQLSWNNYRPGRDRRIAEFSLS